MAVHHGSVRLIWASFICHVIWPRWYHKDTFENHIFEKDAER